MKLGDAVAVLAKPIARGLDAVLGTDLQNCQSCHGPGGRQERLNQLSGAVVDWFLGGVDKNGSSMAEPSEKTTFIVTKTHTRNQQLVVEAVSPEEAEDIVRAGGGISAGRNTQEGFQVQARPPQPQQPQVLMPTVLRPQPPPPARLPQGSDS